MYINTGLNSKSLYRMILEKPQVQPKFRLVDNQMLAHRVLEESQRVVIVVDEAHELDPTTLGDFRFLTNYHVDSFSPISLWLIGQTELRERMKLRVLASLSQRIQIGYHYVVRHRPLTNLSVKSAPSRGAGIWSITLSEEEPIIFDKERVREGTECWHLGRERYCGPL